MSYLRLTNATTDSCDFKVKLSNDFNREYYKRLRITSTNYGDSTSDVRRYVESITARTSSSRYVRGEVNDGMSAGNKYKLYAYAQAQNGTWYLAGSDTIRMEDDEGSKAFDYVIRDINTDKSEPFEIGDEVEFTVVVYNYKREEGPEYKVILKDMDGNRLDYDNEPSLDGKKTNNAYVSTRIKAEHINNEGKAEFKFVIESRDSGYIESDSSDNEETVEYAVSEPVIKISDDNFHLKHMSASGETVTEIENGTIYDSESISASEKGKWYTVKFDENGKANFWINSAGLSNDLDLFVYASPDTSGDVLDRSIESPGAGKPDDIVRGLDVTADVYYYVYVKKYGGKSLDFKIKAALQDEGNSIDQMLNQFPDHYRSKLRTLLEAHPTWILEPMEIDLEWNTFIAEEDKGGRNLVNYPYRPTNWIEPNSPEYYSGWKAASTPVIEYFADPRTYFDERYLFGFEKLSYDSSIHNKAGVKEIFKNTFMDTDTYINFFMTAAAQNNVSPYFLASMARMEMGDNGCTLAFGTVSGYKGYYNYYNIKACGSDPATNGAIHAKEMGWNSIEKAIIGGAEFSARKYIRVGQNTKYLFKFDLVGDFYSNQYVQNIEAAYHECGKFYDAYKKANSLENEFVFRIPIFKSMPSSPRLKP